MHRPQQKRRESSPPSLHLPQDSLCSLTAPSPAMFQRRASLPPRAGQDPCSQRCTAVALLPSRLPPCCHGNSICRGGRTQAQPARGAYGDREAGIRASFVLTEVAHVVVGVGGGLGQEHPRQRDSNLALRGSLLHPYPLNPELCGQGPGIFVLLTPKFEDPWC